MNNAVRTQTCLLIHSLVYMYVCYSNLPAKPVEEAQKHRQQYEEMVAQAKKRGEAVWQETSCLFVLLKLNLKLNQLFQTGFFIC